MWKALTVEHFHVIFIIICVSMWSDGNVIFIRKYALQLFIVLCSLAFYLNGTPLQCSCLENPMDGGARWAAVHGVAKSRARLSDFTFTFCFHALEKEMATHSSVLAWRIPGTEEPSGLPSMGSHRVGHDWSDLAAAAAFYLRYKPWIQIMVTDTQIFIKSDQKLNTQ